MSLWNMQNAVMLCTGINKVIPNEETKLPEDSHDIVRKFRCEGDDTQKDCVMGDCLSCCVTNLSLYSFGRSSYERSDSDVSDDAEGINTDVKHYEWRRHDGRYTKKTLVWVSKNEELVLLNQQIKILKKLIYVKKCQVKHYNKILNQTK